MSYGSGPSEAVTVLIAATTTCVKRQNTLQSNIWLRNTLQSKN